MSTNNTFDINILVNGNKCKFYNHEGKTFVEAKQGSEYVIEIKNNYWNRIETVCAVDGLDVLTGKSAHDQNTGYIIPAYSAEKIKGFRFSDDEWALFKFGYKMFGGTYAQSKQDGSEANCGVIGLRLYYEHNPIMYTLQSTTWYPQTTWTTNMPNTVIVSASMSPHSTHAYYTNDVQYGCCLGDNDGGQRLGGLYGEGRFGYSTSNNVADALRNALGNKITAQNFNPNFEGQQPKGFDMGTEWGKREKSKVTTVSFNRGYLAHSLDIYYASRESLIEMGVPIYNKMQVNLPQSFPSKYAEPPKGWQG